MKTCHMKRDCRAESVIDNGLSLRARESIQLGTGDFAFDTPPECSKTKKRRSETMIALKIPIAVKANRLEVLPCENTGRSPRNSVMLSKCFS